MKALIDTEVYLYRAAAACEWEAEWAPDDWTYLCRHGDAQALFQDTISEIRDTLPDHDVALAFGARASFRYGVWPKYKSKRKEYRKPAGYRHLIEWVDSVAAARGWELLRLPDVEADDVLGIHHQEGDVIVSVDKDMLTLPGLHLHRGELREVSRLEADLAFYTQAITGDSTDGYPGCPGAGAAAAAKALSGCSTELEMWQAALRLYAKKELTEKDAIAQARCARILRAGEYDLTAGTPLLWEPPVA